MPKLYIEPSELRSNSKTKKYLIPQHHKPGERSILSLSGNNELESEPVDGLEELTGADLMISPPGMMFPATDFLIKRHIQKGALLIQVKFDHDLVSSITDGRYKEAQLRMIECDAAPWQRILLFIGTVKFDEDINLIVNRTKSYVNKFKYPHFVKHRTLWSMRGGIFVQLPSAKHLPFWIIGNQLALVEAKENKQKICWPQLPVLYEEMREMSDNPSYIEREWYAAQILTRVNNLSVLYASLPGIGYKKAMDIYDQYPTFKKFQTALDKGSIEIKGIGKKTIENIKEFLNGNIA